jgi:hypothetical protein
LFYNVELRDPLSSLNFLSGQITGVGVPVPGIGGAPVPVPVPVHVPVPSSAPVPVPVPVPVSVPVSPKVAAEAGVPIQSEAPQTIERIIEQTSDQPSEIEPLIPPRGKSTQMQRQESKTTIEQDPAQSPSGKRIVLAKRRSTNEFEEASMLELGTSFALVKYAKDQNMARVKISDIMMDN